MPTQLTRSDVGAWVVIGNPVAEWGYFADNEKLGLRPGDQRENAWTVRPNYRADLIEPGDLIVLWLVGIPEAGIYELGVVTDRPSLEEGRIGGDDVLSDTKRSSTYRFVPFESLILPAPILAADMKADADLKNCEHLRAPMVPSATYLTPAETMALSRYPSKADLKRARWDVTIKRLAR